ncbi:DUF262 domain-containing protein [Changpingibacter yushuensis]|uniref:DUF262 domain-containing protein n=1 Tax=Changpingibacter yushuensis TaxID=2758440 RepID=UPI00165D96CF|nr:DUF262 domain-containing protein [Changpingibacter yushuensis]
MANDNSKQGTFEELEVSRIAGRFEVRGYQRGYRWTKLEVTRLLQDILDSEGSTYYLQPIVVKWLGEDQWELIDGQQRLTTLALIVRYFASYKPEAEVKYTVKYTIEYKTRPGSTDYLLNPTEEDSQKNIDFFHMYEAWEAIAAWLDEQHDPDAAASKVYTAFSKHVKVIWYVAPAGIDSIELFTRLNIGRIPLSDAELVKALVLSRSRDIKGNDRAFSIASEWDAIERDLREPELWAFATARADESPTHISLLLDTLADKVSGEDGERSLRGKDRPPFHTFETLRPSIIEDPESFWNSIVDLHSLLVGWYEDREAFHRIGYLTANGVRFGDLLELASDVTNSTFLRALDDEIAKTLSNGGRRLTVEELRDLGYDDDKDRIKKVLFLMNVETVRKRKNSSERYSFQAHADRPWSLEHIHPQNPSDLSTASQWEEWLRQHRNALDGLTGSESDVRTELAAKIDAALATTVTRQAFQELETEIRNFFSAANSSDRTPEEHTISNLALLERADNSALSDAVFEVKRRRILDLDRKGSYIPACTRNVFLKYYTDAPGQQIHFWSPQDRDDYLSAIEQELAPYLEPEETV